MEKLSSLTSAMGLKHQYDPVQQVDDGRDEPQPTIIKHVKTPWWKLVLWNVVAAGAGAGAMYLATHDSTVTQTTSGAVASAAASVTPSAASSAVHAVATPSIEYVNTDVAFPDPLDGIILDCGFSPEEARDKGCVYDVMMQDWVPEPCYDPILTERYLKEGNWTWYADGDGKTTMTDEVMRKGEHGRAWMSTSYHKAHCVFSWMKIIRALRNNRGISQELLSYDHVMHCAHGALKEESDDGNLGVSAPTNYAKCALYNTWRAALIPDTHDSTQR